MGLINLFLAGGIIFSALWLIRAFANTPPAKLAQLVKTVGGLGTAGLALLLIVRGRWEMGMAIGGVALWLLGLAAPPGWAKNFRTAGSKGQGVSRVRSAMIEMELDHDTGRIDGLVLAGRMEGARLAELDRPALDDLYRMCRADDPEGARLLEAYLDRRFPGWRAADQGDSHRSDVARGSPTMSEDEAYEVLGLHKDATREDVARAHRSLMKKLHPDHGGTTSLAARVNEAKDVLMRRHR